MRRIANRERLIFALDVPDLDGAKRLVETLADSVVFYKIGLELATSRHYFELLDWLVAHNKQVFADLKLYDIPATVTAAVRQLRAVHGKMERPPITTQPARRPVPAVQGNAAVAGEWTEF